MSFRICFRVALVFALQHFRERYVLDGPLSTILNDAMDEFIKRMSYASTTIVDTGKFRMFPEIKDDVHYVVNVDEIANLFTVTKSSCPFKEGDFACILQFVEF